MVSIDSWRAASIKAQVFTTTRSAASGETAGSRPSPVRVPTNLSESTWFFGQPNVSIQYRSATRTIYWAPEAGRPHWAVDGPCRRPGTSDPGAPSARSRLDPAPESRLRGARQGTPVTGAD